MPDKISLGIWRHFKGGYYEVIAVAAHARTAEIFVVYRNLTDSRWIWTRSAKEFTEEVEFHSGVMVPRFIYVRPTDSPVS